LFTSFNLGHPLCALGQIYVILLIARAIFSWFPLSPGSALIPVVRFLHTVTEPVLAPLRKVIPPVGMFDMSFLVTVIVLELIVVPLLCRI
jgi:YggT family protein